MRRLLRLQMIFDVTRLTPLQREVSRSGGPRLKKVCSGWMPFRDSIAGSRPGDTSGPFGRLTGEAET